MARNQRLDSSFSSADAFIGIATNIPVIQLVHFINSTTILNLSREEDLPAYLEKAGKLICFRFFYHQNDEYRSDFCLLSNSSTGINLIPKLKHFTYFLVIQGAIPRDKVMHLIKQINSINGVQMAADIKPEEIPALGSILQDLELHLTELKKAKSENQKPFMPLSEDQ
ncbi:MAG: IPExxxVDY family protein [Bacteroidota bacterium]